MKIRSSYRRSALAITTCLAMTCGGLATATIAEASVAPPTLDLRVLLIGDGASDPTTAAWAAALTNEGAPYTEVDATGATATAGTSVATGSWTITLPTLSSGNTGNYDGVVVADSPLYFASGQLSALYSYESNFGARQVDGYMYPDPALGATDASGGALDGTTGTLTAAGLAAFPELAGPIPFATGTYGYPATATGGAAYTPLITNSAGDALAGIYQHPGTGVPPTDAQAGVAELSLYFNYGATQLQWLLLAPGLINWVTQGTHLGEYQNYVEMDIDDTFTPDDAWDTATHEIDYADGDSLRMTPQDVITSAEWSQANNFRLDQLFNYGSTVAAQAGGLAFAGSTVDSGKAGADPLLAQFQATDPKTGKPYADDFGWISHTYDTPYLDVGCATQNYIEAELNENTSKIAAAPTLTSVAGTTSGEGGLGITDSTDDTLAYGAEDPQVFVPGNHSGFADLVPGNPATVDEPDLDQETAGAGGSLAAGTYEYAVTDQFTGAPVTATLGPDGESAAYVTDPITVPADGSVNLQWESICHAANYNVYRAPVVGGVVGSWTLVGNYNTPFSATLPDNSSADTTGASTTNVAGGGETELTFTDTGSAAAECQGDTGYCVTAGPASWTTPPVDENAEELPWESNPYFVPAMQAAGITAVGADASKPYPNPPDAQFGYGVAYPMTAADTYAAGTTFLEGTPTTTWPGAQVVPRHPINIYYNVSTDAQELDEYNTLYTSTLATYPDIVNSVASQMLQYMLTNNPEPSYVHQTNIIGMLPGCTDATWAANPNTCETAPDPTCTAATCMPATAPTAGDGTLYSVLDPLLAAYHTYFSALTPYVQLTEGQIGTVLADQSAWSAPAASDVTATETNGVVTITNTGTSAIEVPATMPNGTTTGGAAFGQAYGGDLSAWVDLAAGASVTLNEKVPPSITSAASATSNVGAAFSFTVYTTGEPVPALSEVGTLPSGITFTDNGNGTATIAGTPATGSGGLYPFTIDATGTAGSTSQAFVLTNTSAPTITSPATATFTTTFSGSYDITTTGYPAPTLTDTASTLPSGLAFVDNGNGTGSISGTPATGTQGSYPVVLQATNSSGSTATLDLGVTVNPATAPALTIPAADFTLNQMGSVAVAASGYPTPSITETGALPAGLTFIDNGNGTAMLSGTPTSTGTTSLTVTATNGVSPAASQTMTVIVGQAPAITSAGTASATVGSPFTMTVTTSGYPVPSIGATGLPAGFSLTDNGNGTATISGTPTASEIGTNTVDLSAVNVAGSATQDLSLSIGQLPAITSVASTAFTVGAAGSFSVTTTGSLTATLTETGALPAGVSLTDNGNGTATISGTPAAGTTGSWPLEISATSTVDATSQSFDLSVYQVPAFTSASSTTGTVGTALSFTVGTTGFPAPYISSSSSMPAGLTLTDNADGTATISGIPTSAGASTLDLTATNAVGTTPQSLVVTISSAPVAPAPIFPVSTSSTTVTTTPPTTTAPPTTTPAAAGRHAPTFKSVSSATASVGHRFSFTVMAAGEPVPTLVHSALPKGLVWSGATGGHATISGVPQMKAAGTAQVLLRASSAAGSATQVLVIRVLSRPRLSSGRLPAGAVGRPYRFALKAFGYPKPTVKESGDLPAGLSFKKTGSGELDVSGIPAPGSGGAHHIRIVASNSMGKVTMNYTLMVKGPGA